MDDVQNVETQTPEGVSLRKQMGLITPHELARALGVSEVTLQVWRQKGTGPRFTKLGKNIFYPMREVQKWTETNVLDRVNERVQHDAPVVRYKTGEVVDVKTFGAVAAANIDVCDWRNIPQNEASTADEIDQALTKLIGPNEDD